MKFKVGDKVKIVKTLADYCKHNCGICPFTSKIGTVTKIHQGLLTIEQFKGMGSRFCSGFREDMLESADKVALIQVYGIAKWCNNYYNKVT